MGHPADGQAGPLYCRLGEVEGQEPVTAAREQPGQLPDRAAGLKSTLVALPGQASERDGVLAPLIPCDAELPGVA